MTRPVPTPDQRPPVPEVHPVGSTPPPLRVLGVRVGAALVGAAAVIVSSFLGWVSGAVSGGGGFDVPLQFLVNRNKVTGGPAIGLLVLALGVVGALAALGWLSSLVGRAAGLGALAVPTLFLVQLERLPGGGTSGRGVLTLGTGAWLCAAGGLALLLSSPRQP